MEGSIQEEKSDVMVEITASAPEERIEIFKDLSINKKKRILLRLRENIAEGILSKIEDAEIKKIIRVSDPDEGADILQLVEKDRREKILKKLQSDRRKRIDYLLDFDPETAAGLMDLAYITVDRDDSFSQVAERVRKFEERRDKFPTILVLEDEIVLGELPGSALSLTDTSEEKMADQ